MACALKPCRVAPVGLAFKKFKDWNGEEEFLKLHREDRNGEMDHHSTNRGSYLAACVHYSMIFGESCTGNSYRRHWRRLQDDGTFKEYKISDENTKKLQEAADAVVGSKEQRKNYFFYKRTECQPLVCEQESSQSHG